MRRSKPHLNRTLPAAFAAIVLAAACSGVLQSDKPARQVFLLHPVAVTDLPALAAPPAALVLSVSAVPGLDTDRLLVLGRDARLNPVANARWADFLPEVIESLARRSLADTGRFGPVRRGEIARPDEWLLLLELQAFYGLQDGAALAQSVELRLEAQLSCRDGQHVLRIEHRTAAGGDGIAALAAAHQRVADAALRELAARIIAACEPS